MQRYTGQMTPLLERAKRGFLNALVDHCVQTGQARGGFFAFLLFTTVCPPLTVGRDLKRNVEAV